MNQLTHLYTELVTGTVLRVGLGIFLTVSLVGCATDAEFLAKQTNKRASLLTLWHDCVGSNLELPNSDNRLVSLEDAIQHTLIACQGYRADVISTFPRHLEMSVDKIMVQQTYDAAYAMASGSVDLSKPIKSVTNAAPNINKFRP